ncbi:hypothetical protein BDZ89DRAFT_1036796 [Hymenopellis radicata]|nr:hypothetical protein BDZ89DRAFT_1036796 [Hymenopellis radicata]
MGRKAKYLTPEEKLEAKRARARRWYHNHRDEALQKMKNAYDTHVAVLYSGSQYIGGLNVFVNSYDVKFCNERLREARLVDGSICAKTSGDTAAFCRSLVDQYASLGPDEGLRMLHKESSQYQVYDKRVEAAHDDISKEASHQSSYYTDVASIWERVMMLRCAVDNLYEVAQEGELLEVRRARQLLYQML